MMSTNETLQKTIEAFHNSYWSAVGGMLIGLAIQLTSGYIVYYKDIESIRSDESRSPDDKKKAIDQLAFTPGKKPDFFSIINAALYMPWLIICIMNISRIHRQIEIIGLIVAMILFSLFYFIIGKSFFGKWWLAVAQILIWIAVYFLFVSNINIG